VPSIAFVAGHLFLLLALVLTAAVAGRLLLRGLTAPLALAPAGGLALLGALGFLLGTIWQLSRPGLLLALAVLCLAAFVPRQGAGRRLLGEWRRALRAAFDLPRPRLAGAAAGLLLLGAPLVLLALYPPTAFDEGLYHLPFARAFAASGGLPVLPDPRFPVFPQLAEVLFAEVLLVAPDSAIHLVAALAVLLTAGLLWSWGRAAADPWAGALAAAVWLGHPLVVYLGGTAYVEPLLALFGTAAAYAAWRWWTSGERGWLALAGFLAGSAAGVKYLGLFLVGLLVAFAALAVPAGERSGWRWRLAHLALAGGAALLALLPWYARVVAVTGNPVFPYLTALFGENAWTSAEHRMLTGPDGPWPYLRGLLLLPWRALFDRPAVGWMPPASPVWLVALPLLAWGAWRDRLVRFALLPAVAFALVFPFLPQDVRYLVMVLPLACLALGVTLVRLGVGTLPRPYARQTAAVLALLLVLPGWLYAGYRMARLGPIPASAAERDAFFTRQLPLYPAVVRLNREQGIGEVAYGLYAEQMRAFVRGRYLSDYWGLTPNGRLLAAAGDPAAFHRILLSWDVDYLLIARQRHGFGLPATPPWRARFLPLYADPAAELSRVVPAERLAGVPWARATIAWYLEVSNDSPFPRPARKGS
jgi:4-amino-4-deoxy-L-arabinose transferase-like glycosyltransferase